MLTRPVTVTALPTANTVAPTLRSGQMLTGIIRGTPGQLVLQAGTHRIPLEANTALTPGTTVSIEVLGIDAGLELRLTPQTEGAPLTEAASRELPQLLARIIEGMPTLRDVGQAQQLLPRAMPPTEAAVRHLLSLFTTRQSFADDLGQLVELLHSAAQQGAIPADTAEALNQAIGRFLLSGENQSKETLQQLASGSGAALEARLAAAVAAGDLDETLRQLRTTLRWQVAQLRGNTALLRFLQGTRQLDEFQRAVDRVLERLGASQLQNLHGLDTAYLFLELPVMPDSGIEQAQIHFFGEGSGDKKRFDPQNATVVFDLQTTALGSLWINLQTQRGVCACSLRTTNASAQQSLRAAAPDLEAALASAGYEKVRVSISLWEGDRLKAIAQLMRRFGNLDTAI